MSDDLVGQAPRYYNATIVAYAPEGCACPTNRLRLANTRFSRRASGSLVNVWPGSAGTDFVRNARVCDRALGIGVHRVEHGNPQAHTLALWSPNACDHRYLAGSVALGIILTLTLISPGAFQGLAT